jgi:hypothetical protein
MRSLKVGDTVNWYRGFGLQAPIQAVVTRIEIREHLGEDRGAPVEEADWDTVKKRAIVDLDNGKWAHGYQIEPLPDQLEQTEIPE